jgi:hypothetical protein
VSLKILAFGRKTPEPPLHGATNEQATQEALALEEVANAILRMTARGVTKRHIAPSALVMWGIALMEQFVSRKAIGLWLQELSEKYLNSVL